MTHCLGPCHVCGRQAAGFSYKDPNFRNSHLMHFCSMRCMDRQGQKDWVRLEKKDITEFVAMKMMDKLNRAGIEKLGSMKANQWTWFYRTVIFYMQLATFPQMDPDNLKALSAHEEAGAKLGGSNAWDRLVLIGNSDLSKMAEQDIMSIFEAIIEGHFANLEAVSSQVPF